ncbi:lysozyme inhibitor LprI family protein [Lacrimispora sp. BS-2]|uniref:Lysozyme inhibitor LprI family protein n=1 Tax=Lacrimispora sp. BS-2 TaxID=3151850 RepID=A0AAU7PT95_9FIRM
MNKNRGIWIVIGSILVIGILITLATSSFVKSKENVSDPMGITGLSNSEVPEAYADAKGYGGTPELFSADAPAPKEAPASAEEPKQRKAGPVAAPKTETVPDNSAQPAEAGLRMKIAIVSDEAEPAPQAAESSNEASIEETVISPISPDSKSRPVNSAGSSEGAAYYQKHLFDLDAQIKKMRQESGDSNTYSMKALADKELKLWNRELNAIYAAILEELNDEDIKSLETSQQAWIKSRDAKAEEAAKKYSGGSLEEVEYTASLAESTRARAYDLVEEYMDVLSLKEEQ